MPSTALGLAEAGPMYDHGRAWRAAFWLRMTRVSPAANIVAASNSRTEMGTLRCQKKRLSSTPAGSGRGTQGGSSDRT